MTWVPPCNQEQVGFSQSAHTQSTLAYLQELLTLGVAKTAHSNPVKRNSKPSLGQLNHLPAQGKKKNKQTQKQRRRKRIRERHHRNNQNVTTFLIPSFIPLTTCCSDRTAVQEQPKMWMFKNKMLHLPYKRIGRSCTCFTDWLMLIHYPSFYLVANK